MEINYISIQNSISLLEAKYLAKMREAKTIKAKACNNAKQKFIWDYGQTSVYSAKNLYMDQT